jgi:hypothetical protein
MRRSTKWVAFLAVSAAGLVSLVISTSNAQVDAPQAPPAGQALDQARAAARKPGVEHLAKQNVQPGAQAAAIGLGTCNTLSEGIKMKP